MESLGTLLSSHPVDNRPRWPVGGCAALIGLASTVLMALFLLHPVLSKSGGKFAGLLLIGVVVGFGVAAVQLSKAFRGGPRERFDVHEYGIAHVSRRGQRAWTWDQVRWVRATLPSGRIQRWGWNYSCRADFTDGRSLQFNGLTTDPDVIAEVTYAACPEAVALDKEVRGWRLGRWILPLLAIGFGWAAVEGFLWLNEDHRVTIRTPDGSKHVDTVDDSDVMLVATGMICCIIAFGTSLTYLFRGTRAQFDRRAISSRTPAAATHTPRP